MSAIPDIHEIRPADFSAVEALYPKAFPEEDLLPLVSALLRQGRDVISLVATLDGVLVGHIALTSCRIEGVTERIALLGPLAVTPEWQGRGIGGALIRDSLERLKDQGFSWVFVLGDPGYYGRFGFQPETHLLPPYEIPEEWRTGWQSICLTGNKSAPGANLIVPPVWRNEALWQP
ncbi:MAG: N-acetyltransferase [Oceanibaculum nanhaiense]|jgi:putative acetyltransferase|uniref:GNAT family N-acetyltransferase n=1 Tax=Oceanibaculum nanhaiense TaxID=1909734 RepID=UPI0032EBEEE4